MSLLHRCLDLRETARSVEKLLSAPQETGGDATRDRSRLLEGRFELREVSLTYPGERKAALSDITLSIAPGERVGVIGRIGCGKTSLLRILVRLYEASAGSVSLDGHDIRLQRHTTY
jgi:ATP-binding cassette, subfamily C, bacterial LapB